MITPDRLRDILLRLAAVEDGHTWKFEPKHKMFVGSTNAVVMYDRVVDLGRTSEPWQKGGKRDALTLALGEFLENVREDLRELLENYDT